MNDVELAFHDYYRTPVPPDVRWLGYVALKCPMDLWIYQELIYEHQPHYIIETGTAAGGSALFMATICDAVGKGTVLTIDKDSSGLRPRHSRIEYFCGNTQDTATWGRVQQWVGLDHPRMFVFDDDHDDTSVYTELNHALHLMQEGDLVIVEDTDLGGPLRGLEKFLKEHPERSFSRIDRCERLKLTYNPEGYLRCNR